jgi:hypothetical protein
MKRLIILVSTLALVAAASDEWHIETVDSSDNVGSWTSIALDSSDYPHISYYYDTNGDLKYARWDGNIWQIETVDSVDNVGDFNSLALDSSNFPHISYDDYTNCDLKYARWNGSSWQIEIVVDSAYVWWSTSLVLDDSDYPRIAYSTDPQELKYAWWNGSAWYVEEVDSHIWGACSLELDSSEHPHISYFYNLDNYLKHAYRNGGWQKEIVDSGSNTGLYNSLVVDSSDHPHISYYAYASSSVKYARWDGAAWQIETVDSGGDLGKYISLALDSSDYPHISYYDDTHSNLKYARWDGAAWQIETVDSPGDVGLYTSLAVDEYDNPRISYYDYTNGDLKYAWYGDPQAVEDVELLAEAQDEGILLDWTIAGDAPASFTVLRSAGEGEPVYISGPLPGAAARWLDTDAYDASDKGLKPLAYWLEVVEEDGSVSRFGPTEPITYPGAARELTLDVYPSPAADSVTIDYTLPEGASVTLALYDLAGRRVDTLVDAETTAGRHGFVYDVSALSPGVYLAHLETETGSLTQRLVVAR